MFSVVPKFKNSKTLCCCKQINGTKYFKSTETKQEYEISHNINCNSKWFTYLLQSDFFKIQYCRKNEGLFTIGLNNLRKAVKDASAIDAGKPFTLPGHSFSTNSKFVLIEQLTNKTNIKTGARKKD